MLTPKPDVDPDRLLDTWKLVWKIAHRSTLSQPWLFEDAYQEGMLRAWERIEQGHPQHIVNYAAKQAIVDLVTGGRMTGSKLRGGGRTDAARHARSIYRTDKDGDRVEYVVEPVDGRTAEEQDLIDLRDELRRAMEVLAPHHREILYLFYWEGLEQAAIAARLGIKPQSVSAAILRSYPRLRKALEEAS